MKYTDLHSFELRPGALANYLKSLGVSKIDSFTYRPSPVDYESPWDLEGMELLIDRLHYHFERGSKFFLQVDSDTDGYTSSSEFYNYFKLLYPEANIQWRVHKGKEHGVIVSTVPDNCDVVIIPDAGSNQVEEMEELVKRGKEVLVMDHHIIHNVCHSDNVVIVNNQKEGFHNKSLSGSGVVYKTIQAYDEKYNNSKGDYKHYEDLAGLGIISDAMDTRTLDNNAIIRNGLKHIENPMLKALVEKQSYSIKTTFGEPTKLDMAFYIAPLINATIRSGTDEEKRSLFEGFVTPNSTEIIESVNRRGEKIVEGYYEHLARAAVNLRGRQNTQKDRAMKAVVEIIEEEHLDENKVLIVKTGAEDVPQNITGLVAMGISAMYNKPTLILRPVKEGEEIYYRGSGRATPAAGFDSFMDVLNETGVMDYVEGHDNAFGASVLEYMIPELTERLNVLLEFVDFENTNFVHCCVDDTNWNATAIKEFAEAVPVYGQGIPQPIFHFDFQLKPSDFRVQGSRQDSLKFQYRGVVFVLFFCSDLIEQYQELAGECYKEGKEIHIECIGKAGINEYQGFRNINVILNDIELTLCEPKHSSLF